MTSLCFEIPLFPWQKFLWPVVLKLDHTSESSGALVKIQTGNPTSRTSDPVDLEWDLRIYIFNKSPGDADADAVGPGIILWEPLPRLLGMTALKESFCHHENPVNTVAFYDIVLYPSQKIVIGGEKILKFF